MKSYLLGFIGLLISALLIYTTFSGLPRKHKNLKKEKLLIWTIIGVLAILAFFIIGIFIYKKDTESVDMISTIIFSLALTPFLEEFVYRRIILQYFINLSKGEMLKIDFLIPIVITFALILPNTIYYYLLHTGTFSFRNVGILLLFTFLPLCSISLLRIKPWKFNNCLVLFPIIVSQAFLFAMGHGDYIAQAHIITGLIYGILYLQTESIVPPLIAHYLWNILIFINGM